jgi:hypothetical protein
MRFEPQRTGRNCRIKTGFLPPRRFIAIAMNLAMVPSTQRDSELIADLAPHCPALCEAQVVGIRGLTAAIQTRLLGYTSDVIAVSKPARLDAHAWFDAAGVVGISLSQPRGPPSALQIRQQLAERSKAT